MELTRRDALAALGAAGLSVGGALAWSAFDDDGDPPEATHEIRTLVAVARVVYPSDVDGVEAFVETYAARRFDGPGSSASESDPSSSDGPASDAHESDAPASDAPASDATGLAAVVADLDAETRAWYDEPFADLDRDDRDQFLRGLSVDTADPDPDGDLAERVRHYLVNDLLFALYSTPIGGELIGIENPPGHPGGLASYRRGPET